MGLRKQGSVLIHTIFYSSSRNPWNKLSENNSKGRQQTEICSGLETYQQSTEQSSNTKIHPLARIQ